ncbi:calmodulin-binding transcription activator 5-like isoform X2 [Canna indica]|uniref:Calmodulin-binding transcription activator 5-like isoform X2 n=1 Tax=Canna indica TaxID=4628 RepID=A0AAQ3K1J0_9LILI|nr:calmodulin-binding transcription activator 5-like isoform X2 [Canna indica]
MESGDAGLLAGADIHGFRTLADLDVEKLLEDARTRWFRPNEVHAVLSNYTLFKIQPQPIDNPTSGRVLLFDRKMLRNFRKDGHNWKKKKDGKTIQEAHEKLKIGNEDRIHVYYARSEGDPNFYRRCYWLLDKSLERIVLVHYRQTLEDNGFQQIPASVQCTETLSLKKKMHNHSPSTPVHSATGSAHSEVLGSAFASEEINSGDHHVRSTGSAGTSTIDNYTDFQNHELSLHEINTLEWEELVGDTAHNDAPLIRDGDDLAYDQQRNGFANTMSNGGFLLNGIAAGFSSASPSNVTSGDDCCVDRSNGGYLQAEKDKDMTSISLSTENLNHQVVEFDLDAIVHNENTTIYPDDFLLSQNSFGNLLDDLQLQVSSSVGDEVSSMTTLGDHTFNIIEISPGWSYSTEETKVIVVGYFSESKKHLLSSNIYCVFGELCVEAEMVQPGVYRCKSLPQPPGQVDLFLTMDGHTPISQVLSFEYRCLPDNPLDGRVILSEDDFNNLKWEDYQKRLAYLLFSTSNNASILSGRISVKSLNEAKEFSLVTSSLIEKNWMNLLKPDNTNMLSSEPSREDFLELILRSKLQEWLYLKIAQGCETTSHDSQGLGIIHLCAILNYTWAVRLYSLSGLSLDFRDTQGWTALHWAAHYGREKMVAALLSAGANPSLVTDPTSESRGGRTAADLASKQGYEGLAAYLAEKGLTAHFQAMSLSGNISTHGMPTTPTVANSNVHLMNLSEQECCLKESLAAYRNAADAADRIQSAIRERALKLQTKAIQLVKPEMEASEIVAAMKIQHAFHNYNRRKMMKAAARIQSHFRTWKIRRDFVNMRKKAIKIQAAFRGHQERKQYRKICWSVGVLEKSILRWRLKRKGLRGIQVENAKAMRLDIEPESTGEEEFYRVSREQAEDRVQRSVVRVQAMFRSYRAQQEYRRMKMVYEQAKLEFNEHQ